MPTSLWSEISWRGLARHATQSGEPLAAVVDREAERIAVFSRASPIPTSTEPDTSPPGHPAAPITPDLEDQVRKRRAWWRTHLDRRAMYNLGLWGRFFTHSEERKWTTAFSLMALVPGLAMLSMWLVGGTDRRIDGTLITALVALALAALGFSIPIYLSAREHKMSMLLRESRCTSCGTRIPTNNAPATGPERCDTCGLSWPLVPSPVPTAALAPFVPDASKPAAHSGNAWLSFVPTRGHRPAAWDVIGPAVSAIDPPSLRTASRRTWTGVTLPRFGGRSSRHLHDNTISFAFIAALALASVFLQSGTALGLLMTVAAASLPIFALRKPNAWRYGAFRRERCRPFKNAAEGSDGMNHVRETLLQRRSAENFDLIKQRLRANAPKLHTTTERLIVAVPMSAYFGSFGVGRLVSALDPANAQTAPRSMSGLFCPSVFVVMVMLAYVSSRITRRRNQLIACVGTTRCCDCNYDLAGIPNAIPPESLAGLATGPAQCPECGAPWPLIPPLAT